MEITTTKKPKLLLHICCAGCGAYVSRLLGLDYDLVLYFQNSNIFPLSEFKKREEEVRRIAEKFNLDFIIDDYDHEAWLKIVEGREDERERGQRCYLCYESRMKAAIKKANEIKADAFTTTLSVSPHKVYLYIKKIGDQLSQEFDIKFLDNDFKKSDGAKKATLLSRELNLYRQNYCGCEFSQRR